MCTQKFSWNWKEAEFFFRNNNSVSSMKLNFQSFILIISMFLVDFPIVLGIKYHDLSPKKIRSLAQFFRSAQFHLFYNSSKFLEQILFSGKMHFFTPKRQFSQKCGFWCISWQFSHNKSASNSKNIQVNCADRNNWARDLIFFVGDLDTHYNGKIGEMECKPKKVVFWPTLVYPICYFLQKYAFNISPEIL